MLVTKVVRGCACVVLAAAAAQELEGMLARVQRGSADEKEALCRPFVELMARCLQGSLLVDSGHAELVEVRCRVVLFFHCRWCYGVFP